MQTLSERELKILTKEQDLLLAEERIAEQTRVCLYTRHLFLPYYSLNQCHYSLRNSAVKIVSIGG